jgi:hypothetical protein
VKGYVSRCKVCESIKKKKDREAKDKKINSNLEEYLALKLRNMKKADRRMKKEVIIYPTIQELKDLIDKQRNICDYTGVELVWRMDADIYHKGSFDRYDNRYGHELENLHVVSTFANMNRGVVSHEEYLKKIGNASLEKVTLEEIVL